MRARVNITLPWCRKLNIISCKESATMSISVHLSWYRYHFVCYIQFKLFAKLFQSLFLFRVCFAFTLWANEKLINYWLFIFSHCRCVPSKKKSGKKIRRWWSKKSKRFPASDKTSNLMQCKRVRQDEVSLGDEVCVDSMSNRHGKGCRICVVWNRPFDRHFLVSSDTRKTRETTSMRESEKWQN